MKTGKGTRISTVHNGVVNVLFADGSVVGLQADMPISLWRKLLVGEIESRDELDNWKPNPDDPAPVNLWIDQPPPPPGKWPLLLSVVVWIFSLALLFYRAWYSRKIFNKAKTPSIIQ
jgi:prepilin-type processing-associated H-X9-DG protein